MSKYSVGGYEIPTLLLNEIKILDLRNRPATIKDVEMMNQITTCIFLSFLDRKRYRINAKSVNPEHVKIII